MWGHFTPKFTLRARAGACPQPSASAVRRRYLCYDLCHPGTESRVTGGGQRPPCPFTALLRSLAECPGVAETRTMQAAELEKEFEFRTLASEEELLGPWLDLLVSVFGPLRIPRAYFARHWTSDPPELRRLDWVLVAVDRESGQMVATVRIFKRDVRLSGQPTTVLLPSPNHTHTLATHAWPHWGATASSVFEKYRLATAS